MRVGYYAQNLMLFSRNREWLTSDIKLRDKVAYYPSISRGYANLIRGRKCLNYLGAPFHYDNPATPLNLQNYPYEVGHKILRNMDDKPQSVLDIGGNLGQFSRTMSHMLNHEAHIDVFEPNPTVFELLQANTELLDNIHIHNVGIADEDGVIPFYYEPNRSGTGSAFLENASSVKANIKQIDVKVTSALNNVTKRNYYDLIKIDVEGFEHHVLKGLQGLRCKWLFIEMSSSGRQKDYAHADLLKTIHDTFGSFDIAYSSPIKKQGNTFDMLIEFIPVNT